jgi:hypothetical protein
VCCRSSAANFPSCNSIAVLLGPIFSLLNALSAFDTYLCITKSLQLSASIERASLTVTTKRHTQYFEVANYSEKVIIRDKNQHRCAS